jgi:hypothetical protein
MSKKVYKYFLNAVEVQLISIHEDAEILTAALQGLQLCLWALVDTDKPIVKRKIFIRGTGHDAEGLGKHISTFQMNDGEFVFHVFDEPEPEFAIVNIKPE